jgi:hypothetical protein
MYIIGSDINVFLSADINEAASIWQAAHTGDVNHTVLESI